MAGRGIRLAVGTLALVFAGIAGAQDNLDLGKSGAQLYAADCAICHQSPQKLGGAGGIFGLESFLREHYTASRESAAVIAAYLRGVAQAAPAAPARSRAPKRTAKGEEGAKPGERKAVEKKSGSGKAGDSQPSEVKPAEAKATEPKPSETKPAESKPSEATASVPKPSEPKASEGAKPEKPE